MDTSMPGPVRLRWLPGVLAILGGALGATVARADQFHYANVLVGTRAVGMGGAFGGVADDASGMYYNPAGLAFALNNDIQGSANAFYTKHTKYLKTLGNEDFDESSTGSLSPFFGGLQKMDRYVDGLVIAFGMYYIDGDLKDQDTLLEGKSINSVNIQRYHRTSNARAGSYYAGVSAGYRPIPKLSFGFGLNYYASDELVQEYQYARQTVPAKDGNGNSIYVWRILNSNVRQHLQVYGVQPTLGVQAALPAGFTLGLTLKQGMVASQVLDSASETNTTLLSEAQNAALDQAGSVTSPLQAGQTLATIKSKKPVGSLPMEARLGLAWFATPTFLWTFDISYFGAVTDADKSVDPTGVRSPYAKQAVTNFATGAEWYLVPALPLRFGLFTNNDARPSVNRGTPDATNNCNNTKGDFYKKYCGQPDHIDYMGGSLFIAWVTPNSQISAGTVIQQGSGAAQKLGDYQVQDVKSTQYQLAFSATHNL